MAHSFDCIVCGAASVDIMIRPVPLQRVIGTDGLYEVEPLDAVGGGIVSNSGIAMARLGLRVAVLSQIGEDHWGSMLRQRYVDEGLDVRNLSVHPSRSTGTTAVLIDSGGEHSFAHYVGAWSSIDSRLLLDNLDLFAQSRFALFGYYGLWPGLESDLPKVLAEIRRTGCRTALDAAGGGGEWQPLDRILPHLDVYVPSFAEAVQQTGETDTTKMIAKYRNCGSKGLLGVKLGAAGAVLSPAENEYLKIAPVSPPGPLVDTTGAGDWFYAGLLTGLLHGLETEQAGRVAAAAGACCVTSLGGSTAPCDLEKVLKLAGEIRIDA